MPTIRPIPESDIDAEKSLRALIANPNFVDLAVHAYRLARTRQHPISAALQEAFAAVELVHDGAEASNIDASEAGPPLTDIQRQQRGQLAAAFAMKLLEIEGLRSVHQERWGGDGSEPGDNVVDEFCDFLRPPDAMARESVARADALIRALG